MNFIERIKADMENIGGHSRGMGRRIAVDALALMELLRDYERIDSWFRVNYERGHVSQDPALRNILTEMFRDSKGNAEDLFTMVSDILKPLIEEREKQERILKYANYRN